MIGKIAALFWIGIGMIFLPFFGIPDAWKFIAMTIVGIVLIAMSISLRKGYKSLKYKLRKFEQVIEPEVVIHE